jgi:predicted nucleic acid-binding protein
VWQLRNNLTAHDAVYVALAEGLRVPLVTCDSRLAKAVGIRTSVERFR